MLTSVHDPPGDTPRQAHLGYTPGHTQPILHPVHVPLHAIRGQAHARTHPGRFLRAASSLPDFILAPHIRSGVGGGQGDIANERFLYAQEARMSTRARQNLLGEHIEHGEQAGMGGEGRESKGGQVGEKSEK
jgi:hypothetical protein